MGAARIAASLARACTHNTVVANATARVRAARHSPQAQIVVSTKCRGEIVMLKITHTAQLTSLLLVLGGFAFSANAAEVVPDTAQEQEASLEGSNAPDTSAAAQPMERKTDGMECVRQMPRWRPDPNSLFTC